MVSKFTQTKNQHKFPRRENITRLKLGLELEKMDKSPPLLFEREVSCSTEGNVQQEARWAHPSSCMAVWFTPAANCLVQNHECRYQEGSRQNRMSQARADTLHAYTYQVPGRSLINTLRIPTCACITLLWESGWVSRHASVKSDIPELRSVILKWWEGYLHGGLPGSWP